jgi:hypothetical protein
LTGYAVVTGTDPPAGSWTYFIEELRPAIGAA